MKFKIKKFKNKIEIISSKDTDIVNYGTYCSRLTHKICNSHHQISEHQSPTEQFSAKENQMNNSAD